MNGLVIGRHTRQMPDSDKRPSSARQGRGKLLRKP
jgi:hypothetical protein